MDEKTDIIEFNDLLSKPLVSRCYSPSAPGSTNSSRSNAARLLIPLQYFADTTVRDAQCPTYCAWSHPFRRHFHDPESHVIR